MSGFSWRNASHLVTFAAAPALNLAAPLVAIPIVTGTFGAQTWADLAVGQAVGFIVASIVEYGWPLAAVELLSRRREHERDRIYLASVYARLYLFLLFSALAALLMRVLQVEEFVASVLSMLAVASTGVGSAWYHAANETPMQLLLRDAAIRAAGTPAGAILALSTHEVIFLPAVQVAAGLIAILSATLPFWRRQGLLRHLGHPRAVIPLFRKQWRVAVGRLLTSSAYQLPVVLVAGLAPASVASYAALDRLAKLSVSGLIPAYQVLQGRIASRQDPAVGATILRVSAVAAFGGLAFVLLLPVALQVLFADTVSASWPHRLLFGVWVTLALANRGAQLGYGGRIFVSSSSLATLALATIAGLASVCAGIAVAGFTGAAAGGIIVESLLSAAMGVAVMRRRRKP